MKRCIFIGQAMPRFKKDPHDWPSLNSWLYSIDIREDQIRNYFLYSALVDYFPGTNGRSHRIPTEKEIKIERLRLKATIRNFGPEVVVPIGRLSISYCFNDKTKPLKEYIGNIFNINPYGLMVKKTIVIPFPHPSGASTWYRIKKNRELLEKALGILKDVLL